MTQDINHESNYIKAWLYNSICEVTFTKVDGSTRTMRCTLQPQYLPKQTDLEENIANKDENLVTVWDLDKEAWRCFKINTIKTFYHDRDLVYYGH